MNDIEKVMWYKDMQWHNGQRYFNSEKELIIKIDKRKDFNGIKYSLHMQMKYRSIMQRLVRKLELYKMWGGTHLEIEHAE